MSKSILPFFSGSNSSPRNNSRTISVVALVSFVFGMMSMVQLLSVSTITSYHDPCGEARISWCDQAADFSSRSATEMSTQHTTVNGVRTRTEAFLSGIAILREAWKRVVDERREDLRQGLIEGTNVSCPLKEGTNGTSCPFDNMEILVPLARSSKLLRTVEGLYNETKTLLNPKLLDEDCIVYGLGIARDSSFETQLSQHCQEVHGFDCTIPLDFPSVRDKAFTFHPTCIGPKPSDFETTNYYKVNAVQKKKKELEFKPLMQVMDELGHYRVDYLKFDIEGSEWTIFDDLLSLPDDRLPTQLLFEIHTEGTNPAAVGPELVKGKLRHAVNTVILQFIDRGYALLDFEINSYDDACAEFSLLLLQ